jgi:hypothetical protein
MLAMLDEMDANRVLCATRPLTETSNAPNMNGSALHDHAHIPRGQFLRTAQTLRGVLTHPKRTRSA